MTVQSMYPLFSSVLLHPLTQCHSNTVQWPFAGTCPALLPHQIAHEKSGLHKHCRNTGACMHYITRHILRYVHQLNNLTEFSAWSFRHAHQYWLHSPASWTAVAVQTDVGSCISWLGVTIHSSSQCSSESLKGCMQSKGVYHSIGCFLQCIIVCLLASDSCS